MDTNVRTMQIVYEKRYVGPHEDCQMYEPNTLASCEKALMNANAIAFLAGGCDTELLAHARNTTNPEYDCAIKNLWI